MNTVLDPDETYIELKNATDDGDAEALAVIGWELYSDWAEVRADLAELRAACREVPATAWPAHRMPGAPRAA